jgi:hypothetical protein
MVDREPTCGPPPRPSTAWKQSLWHANTADVVFLDIRMQRIEGLAATRQVLATPRPPRDFACLTGRQGWRICVRRDRGWDVSEFREATPIPGPDAFRMRSRDARLSQAAIVLCVGAAVGGQWDRLDAPEAVGLPAELGQIERSEGVTLEEAVAPLEVDVETYLSTPPRTIPSAMATEMTARLIDQPHAVTAAALVEVNLHSDSRLVRTSAAVAALDTTGGAQRVDVLARLVEGTGASDALTRQIARIGLARVNADHEKLAHLVGRPAKLTGADRPSHTAVVTHGTFAARARWWRPGGDFYTYLDGLAPPLNLHDPSFQWSGLYSDPARQLAAQQLAAWLVDQGLQQPDLFAHSHGGTVANLATRAGAEFDRLVLLSWPVHTQWFPDFTTVQRIVDIRVHLDLVIIADRGAQTFTPPAAYRAEVRSYINGWFDHGATHDPAYWHQYGLPAAL